MTLPTYFRSQGYVTSGTGKIFHPDACKMFQFHHSAGDDPRAWSYGRYGDEANFTQMEWGSIPGPFDPVFNRTFGLSFAESDLEDEQQTDGMLATDVVERLANFSRLGIGRDGDKPFFLAVGFHKPHLPQIVPRKYFDLYDLAKISLAPNRRVPRKYLEENWHALGTMELEAYNLNAGPEFVSEKFAFDRPIGDNFSRALRRAYFAAVSFVDAQVGRVLAALDANRFTDNTIVVLWSDHGWHLGDTNSWGKMTNFETATRNTLLWKVPGQTPASKGLNNRMVESVDLFPTLVDLAGLKTIPQCTGRDQPPSVLCVQGTSYASEFTGRERTDHGETKEHAFTQWPIPEWPKGSGKGFRMGYTVRTATGFRLTEYVPYDATQAVGNWTEDPARPPNDLELYDYNVDRWETENSACDAKYTSIVRRLREVLREEFAPMTPRAQDSSVNVFV